MQEMQEMQAIQQTPRDFLRSIADGKSPHDALIEWGKERNSSASRISRAEVLKGIKEEQERKRALTRPLDVGEMPTLYNVPAIPKMSPYTTEKLPALDLAPMEEDDPCVEITASADCYTLALIDEAVERLEGAPTLIVVSVLRWLVDGKLLKRWQYHYQGVRIPIVPSDGPCCFDVKVWGSNV